ncbi:cytochrome P450 [Vitiosangium sp. GDMCC 1.1324]|uniref:cytochrome P450 n=1 Tax=Vitiosangium sp. (strain GDMCC 1.1324) TaxID=2138576 RepID=UPI000D33488A|nr:cytochrome P450 [Vitiosangium sp. GDMCC 1.1324]PTL78771.1 cytochrome P450 [Vitiosangium sp. GDMCC 1.1324]
MTDSYPMPKNWRCPLDPPAEYKRLRREAPVTRVQVWDGSTPWLITRYDDAFAALGDPTLSMDFGLPGIPHTSPSSVARRDRIMSFPFRPDPEYRAQRAMLVQEFSARQMEALRPQIQRIVDETLDPMLAGPRPTDLMAAFALPMAIRVICDLLGVPSDDSMYLHGLSRTIGSRASSKETVGQTLDEMEGYFHRLVEANVRNPRDTLVGRVVAKNVLTGALSKQDAAAMFQMLFHAGHGPTAYMICMGVLALSLNPDQISELRVIADDPRQLSAAVQELLRYATVSHNGRQRVATEDVTIGGQLIRTGEGVLIQPDSANRDETAFPDPDRLDIHRTPQRNLALGHGIHTCTGRSLALVELEVVFHTLYQRVPTLRVAVPVEDIPFRQNDNLLGAYELPVTW